MGAPFPRALRVRDRRDFLRVGRVGRRAGSNLFVAFVAPLGPDAVLPHASRLGLTVSRRVGTAVVRNRVKRQIREWYRRAHGKLPEARDVVVIARPAAGAATRAEIRGELALLELRICGGGTPRGRC